MIQNNIFSLPIFDKWLIYAPFSRVLALVNYSMLNKLKKTFFQENRNSSNVLIRLIAKKSNQLTVEKNGPFSPTFLGIIPTRACNMACIYCGFEANEASQEIMDPDLAITAVDWMAEFVKKEGRKVLEIHFFGGEPFVAGQLVDIVVHRARCIANKMGLIPRFEVATNGIFDKKRAFFVGNYIDTVVLSFDGFSKIQNFHRPLKNGCGSFRYVFQTACWLSNSPTKLCFRVCVSERNVSQLERIAEWFCKNFRPAVINFEPLQPTQESVEYELQCPDPYEFALHYINAARIIKKYGIQPVYAAAITEFPRYTICPVGTDTLIVTPDGRISACYLLEKEWEKRGVDLNLGCVVPHEGVRVDFSAIKRVRNLVKDKPRCTRCFCKWSCAGGCHVNHSYPGCSNEYDAFCIQTRIITACHLLEELGESNLVNLLIKNHSALENLALQLSDCLEEK